MHILEGTYFGSYYFEAMKLLRESMLMSVITNNLEVSFNLTSKDLKTLNDLDMQLLRGCLLTGAKSPQCLMLLELGLVLVSYLLKKKRILYLHHLLTVDESSLVVKVFRKQVSSLKKGDWVQTVLNDLKDLKIELSFSQIAGISKAKFKSTVKESCEKACFLALLKEMESLKKDKEIQYKSLITQSYLMHDSGLSVHSMRNIYHIRCREIQLKSNHPSAYSDINCPSPGCLSPDTQNHLFTSSCFSDRNKIVSNNTRYEDIFCGDIESQVNVMQIMCSNLEFRRLTLSD